MLLLVSGATKTVRQYTTSPHLGRLIQPRCGNDIVDIAMCGLPWAADNDCFQGLDTRAYRAMLDKIAVQDTTRLLFVTVPDVVADCAQTGALFTEWLPVLQDRGLPPALVAQDGLTEDAVPWGDVRALFIGGSTAWKLGTDAAHLVRAAKVRGVWVHVGRVNSLTRLTYIDGLGVDSFDGTQFSRYPDTYIPHYLGRLPYHQERFLL